MADHPTTSWEAMQDGKVFYRRHEIYSIQGKLPNLGDYIVAACSYAGPIALMRDPTKMIQLGRGAPVYTKSQIQVFSPAGETLILFSWDQAKIIRFGWTQDERLCVLNEEGNYRLYDLQGEYTQYTLGSDPSETGVIDARIHQNGMVAMTGSLAMLEVKDWTGSNPLTLATSGLTAPPHAWAILPPTLTTSRHCEVLLASELTIHTLDSLTCTDQRLSRGPFTHIAPAPNGRSLALLNAAGLLWVVSGDFQRSLAEYDTNESGASGSVKQVEWCGNDALLVTWEGMAVLVGPFGDTLKYFYSGQMYAVTELDGVRVISSAECDFIEKVPSSTVSIFRPGSTSPGATLYDAWDQFSRRSPKADAHIRSIRPELAAAVDECIDAAGREWEPYWQRRLLNAAKFGRGFLDLYDPTDFVNMGEALKVLNAVRFHEIGIPLTYSQYIYASPPHLIARLTSRNAHLLALRISSSLGFKPDVVLKHWAYAKLGRSRSGAGTDEQVEGDNALCKLIVEKFKMLGGSGTSYADIAKRAWEVGRPRLATKLLEHEPRASDQVPLLLSMKEDKLALVKAVDSGDTDLVYHVLLHLYKRRELGDFFRLIEDGGEQLAPANRLLQVYAREQNREMLRDFYYSDDRRVESAVLSLEDATKMTDPASKITSVRAAQKFFSEDKDRAFEAKMMDESARLLAAQQQLEKEDNRLAVFGKSINNTIRECLLNDQPKRADKVKSDFKVPDKRFWFIKLHALVEARNFEALEAFAKSKRSPIGYEPFVRHLIEAGHPKEAATYVARCDANKRVDLYVDCSDWRAAGKECKERNDKAKLEQLRTSCPNSMIQRELDQIAMSMK